MAKSSNLVIASGMFTEVGFSGLEFLAAGHLTLFPEKSDVAELMKQACPATADNFLLKSLDGVSEQQQVKILHEWENRIYKIVKEGETIKYEVDNILAQIRKDTPYNILTGKTYYTNR